MQLICTMIPLHNFMLSHGDSMPLCGPVTRLQGTIKLKRMFPFVKLKKWFLDSVFY